MAVWESELNDADYVNFEKVGVPTYETLQDWLDTTQSAGLLCGGEFTDNTDGSITVDAGCGMVKTVDDALGNTAFFDWAENTNVALSDSLTNWIYIDYNNGSPTVNSTTDFSIVTFTTQFIIGIVYREGTVLHIIEAGSRRFDFAHRVLLQDFEVNGFRRASGLVIEETGTRNIGISEGIMYMLTQRTPLAAIDTSGSDTFTYYYSDGDSGWTEVTGQTQIDNVYYDDGDGTLGELLPNQFGVHWVFQDFSGHVYILYGYDSYKLSAANDAQPPIDVPPFLADFAFISGKVIIEKNASSFAELHSAFDVVFTPSVIIPHNDLTDIQGGATDEYYHLTSAQHTLLTGNLYQSHNLLPNSGFSVNSQSTLENYGTQITLTDVTSGVCLTADTQDIAIGDLFRFDSGDHDTVVGRVIAVTVDTSFTLSDTSLTDSGSPGTGYEAVPGYIAADDKAPDAGWTKHSGADIHVTGLSVIEMTMGSSGYCYCFYATDIRESVPHLQKYRGRTVTFGAYLSTTIAGPSLRIQHDSFSVSSSHKGTGREWLEVTAAIPEDATEFYLRVSAAPGASTTADIIEISEPMLIFGDYIGEGNYAPMPSECVPLDANEVLIIDNATVSANSTKDIFLESIGKIPTGASGLQVRVKGTCATAGKTLSAGQSNDMPIMSQVTTVPNQGAGRARVSSGDLTVSRDDTFTNVDVAVTGVYL